MVFTLLSVLFLMGEAAKPKNWRWLWRDTLPENTNRAVDGPSGRVEPRIATNSQYNLGPPHEAVDRTGGGAKVGDIETRLPERPRLAPGVFISHADTSQASDADMGVLLDSRRPGNLIPVATVEQLASIRDDTQFRRAESKAWFEWCHFLCHNSIEDAEDVTFLQLFQQPGAYRGRTVRVTGIVRRAHDAPARDNDKGIQDYTRCWLFPPDGGTDPMVVYGLELPNDFPTGMSLHVDATFTGVFFKRWAYPAKGGLMTAPLVLSAHADWAPPPEPVSIDVPSLPVIMGVVTAASLLGAAVAWLVYRQSNEKRLPRRRPHHRDLPDRAPELTFPSQDDE